MLCWNSLAAGLLSLSVLFPLFSSALLVVCVGFFCISSAFCRLSLATSLTRICSVMLSISLHFFIYSLRSISLGTTAMLFTTSLTSPARRMGSSPTSLSSRLVLKRMKSTLFFSMYCSTSSVECVCE